MKLSFQMQKDEWVHFTSDKTIELSGNSEDFWILNKLMLLLSVTGGQG